jgi:hypothetical protein
MKPHLCSTWPYACAIVLHSLSRTRPKSRIIGSAMSASVRKRLLFVYVKLLFALGLLYVFTRDKAYYRQAVR